MRTFIGKTFPLMGFLGSLVESAVGKILLPGIFHCDRSKNDFGHNPKIKP